MTDKITSISQFNGAMLVEARTARGLSQSQLAEISGVTKQSISNYENNKQAPRATALDKLSGCLNIPLAFLYTENALIENAPIYFRSLASLHKKERNRAQIKLSWLARLLDCYDEYLELPAPNIPEELDISSRYQLVSDEEIEEIALSCRRAFNIGDGPISNMTMLMENNGVIVVEMPLEVKAEDAFSRWVLNSQIPAAVLVSTKPSACRDRFSLAHELGHLVMHRKVHPTNENLKEIEKQANRFASSFLLPAHSYVRDFGYPSLDVFKLLKEKWKVSIQAQIIRCWQLGLISDDSKRNFFINISKRKWRLKEPLDDIIPVEHPKILRESTKLLCTEGGLTFDEISYKTQLSPDDIAQLTCVPKETIPLQVQKPKLKTVKPQNKVINFPKHKT
ncbi:XRE family transcriptional regulator [Maridesulfovibrio ferrireducens]|uniref:helix-turn-helix domain-containing protein n=1 Tax=Maridesulfovibrio ferrireducens TaxID=246191 RepID=UPI001A22FD9B|nr:XRE family transcriptional regulator [Maridesulfovibrio ferrireducens]MBI9113266.1 ImmA/IrrE family metallo-endopeptidase [Maridesulfovibrio ferrireducens]